MHASMSLAFISNVKFTHCRVTQTPEKPDTGAETLNPIWLAITCKYCIQDLCWII